MEPISRPQGESQSLAKNIVASGSRAFGPNGDEATKSSGLADFKALIDRTPTASLIPALNGLLGKGIVPEWLRERVMETLSLLPLRPDGVRVTLEFVFSVHPSSTVRVFEAATPQKRGANITHEALTLATQLLATPPSATDVETWYSGIAPQLMRLLDGQDGPELVKVSAYVVGFGILGQKRLGAPGTPGWRHFAQPLLAAISPSLAPESHRSNELKGDGEVVDLTTDSILVTVDVLAASVRRLLNLLNSHPNPGLCRRLLKPLLLPLWSLSSWPNAHSSTSQIDVQPSKELLLSYIRLVARPEVPIALISRLLYNGEAGIEGPAWRYREIAQGIEVVSPKRNVDGPFGSPDLNLIGQKARAFVDMIKDVPSEANISTVFIELLKRWLESIQLRHSAAITLQAREPKANTERDLIEVAVLQELMEKCPETLVHRTGQLLELVEGILAVKDAGHDDDIISVALSLLNLVVSAPGFQKAKVGNDTLASIETSLDRLSRDPSQDVATTARNLSLLLRYRDEVDGPTISADGPTGKQIEERKTYSLAVSYISQLDSPPPVRSEGLNLISKLIESNSPVLDVPAVLVLLSGLLKDSEDYVNLRVIKVFTQLASRHPRSVTREILDHYVDAQEKETVDTRLRFGEALLQVIERLGQTFTGDTALPVEEALLSIASRRGHRPKTQARQARDEKARKGKPGRPGEAVDEEDFWLSEDEDQAKNEILQKIVDGWESKKGSEDVRIRASALSIFTAAVETNIAGFRPTVLSSAVDLGLSILTFEPEPEKAILRRSAIILIQGFLRGLNDAREKGERLGFSLTAESQMDISRILNYVAQTDSDGLVQQHATDVLESLENWQSSSLLPEVRAEGLSASLTRLAGLEVNPQLADQVTAARPRIEEVE